ncbi:zinc finger CW-type PWWP domain protein 1, partial [Nephila pilipes]
YYNVTFLDERPTHAWIPEVYICPFLKPPKRDRLKSFSFVHLYKGHWPRADNFEVGDSNDDKEKDITDTLLKEVDDLDSVISTDTDNEKIEINSSEIEKNKFTNKKMTTSNFDAPNSIHEKYSMKYLSNKDFIPKDKAVFPLIKQNNSKKSFTKIQKVDGTKNLLDIGEHSKNDFQSTLEYEGKGIKRSKNKKIADKRIKSIESIQISANSINLHEKNVDHKSSNSETLKTSTSFVSNEIASNKNNQFDMKKTKNKNLKKKDKILPLHKEKSTKLGRKSSNAECFNQNGISKTSAHLQDKNTVQEVLTELVKPTEKSDNELPILEENPCYTHDIASESKITYESISISDSHTVSNEEQFIQNNESDIMERTEKSKVIGNQPLFKEKSAKTGNKNAVIVSQNEVNKTSDNLQKGNAGNKTIKEMFELSKELNAVPTITKENDISTHSTHTASEVQILQHIDESISEVIKQSCVDIETTSVTNLNETILSTTRKNVKESKGSIHSFSVPIKNNNVPLQEVSQKSRINVGKDVKKKTNKVKPLPQTLKKNIDYSTKMKPNFKQPTKAGKQIDEIENKMDKFVATKEEQKFEKASTKENDDDDKNQLKNDINESEPGVNKEVNSPLSKHLTVENKENIPEISIDGNDFATENKSTSAITKSEEDFFYVTISDDELE